MDTETLSTGEVSKKLGFLVTGEFITSMGIVAAEHIKGHPRWDKADWPKLCNAISTHTANLSAESSFEKVARPTPKVKPQVPAVDVSDL